MKNKMKILICSLAVLGVMAFGEPISFMQQTSNLTIEVNASEARAYIYEWYYKVIDGHLYKRLYNASTGEWAGDWILIE